MKTQAHSNTAYCDSGPFRSRSRSTPWHESFMALSMLFFLSVVSALSMLILLWTFSISYQNRELLIQLHMNEIDKNETKWVTFTSPIPVSPEVTSPILTDTTRDSNTSYSSTTYSSASSEGLTIVTSVEPTLAPVERINPINILEEKIHTKLYSCATVCNSTPIISARVKILFSAVGENYILLGTKVQTTDKNIAKRRVAYEALQHLYREDVSRSSVDPEWNLPAICNDETPVNVTWKIKCK